MSFLTPAFLFGALAAAVPVVLHFLRREPLPRVPFSDLRLLRGARVDPARRPRLRDFLLLVLRVAALLLLALAFARPFVADGTAPDAPATVVVVDTSFSLSAPGQAAEARAAARAAVDAAPAGHLVGVVAFDDAARVAAALGRGRGAARAAIDGLSPRPRATRYRTGLAAASALIGDRPGRVVVVSDLQAGGWEEGTGRLAPHVEVETRRVTAPAGNLTVVGIDPGPSQVAVRLRRWGAAEGDTRLTIAVDGAVVDDSRQRVGPGETTIRRPVTLPASGVVSAAVSDPAGYPADDRRYRRLDAPAAAGVLLVADGRAGELYLERALAPGGAADGFTVTTAAAADLGQGPDRLAEAAVVVLAGARGLGRAGRARLAAFVRGGGGLLAVGGPAAAAAARAGLAGGGAGAGRVAARTPGPDTPSSTSAVAGRVAARTHVEPVAMAPADLRHPVVRALGPLAGRLGRSRFTRTAAVDAAGGEVVFAFTDGAPALVEHAAGAGRVLVFAADLRNAGNDLPRQPEFVPFLHEMVRHLVARPARPRDFVVGAAPPGAPAVPGPARLPGVPGRIVLNVDTRESAFTPLTDEAFQASVDRLARAGQSGTDDSAALPAAAAPAVQEASPRPEAAPAVQEEAQGLWRYLLMAMALVLVAEGLLAGRTR